MKRCKHLNSERHLLETEDHVVRWWTCVDCGTPLPTGPSKDTPEVMIEIRAAELADLYTEDLMLVSSAEVLGWNDFRRGDYVGYDDSDWQAGYLARAIATHDEAKS